MPPSTARPVRRAGSRWRILVHQWLGTKDGGPPYGTAYHVSSDPDSPRRGAETARRLSEMRPDLEPMTDTTEYTVLEGTEFDELVIGRWIHLEQMDTGKWWMNVGGVTINVTADRDGRPKVVDVYGPGDYGEPAGGCRYSVTWSADENPPGSETAVTG